MKYLDFLSSLKTHFGPSLVQIDDAWLRPEDKGLFLESKFPTGKGDQTDMSGRTQEYNQPTEAPSDLDRYELIELVLMHFCPGITYLRTRDLLREVVDVKVDWESDGYVRRNYLYVRVNVDKLHRYLIRNKIL